MTTTQSALVEQSADNRQRRKARIIWYGLLLVVMAVSSVGVIDRLVNGLGSTNLTSAVPWGAWVAFYIYFVGLSAGASMVSALPYAFNLTRYERIGRPALLISLVSMCVALAFIGVDLGRLDRATNAMQYFHWSSALSWEVRFYLVFISLLVAQLVLTILQHKGRLKDPTRARQWVRILSGITFPIAILGVLGGEGAIFAVVKARGMWSGGLLPVIFVVSAAAAGVAVVMIAHYVQARLMRHAYVPDMMKGLSKILLGVLLVDAGLTFYEFLIPVLSWSHHETDIIAIMLTGPFAWSFWLIQIGMGLVGPIVILLIPRTKTSAPWMCFAAVLAVVGIIGVRFNIVVPPLIPGILDGYPINMYVPTMSEWMLSAFSIAGGTLVFSAVCEWLPIHQPAPNSVQEVSK